MVNLFDAANLNNELCASISAVGESFRNPVISPHPHNLLLYSGNMSVQFYLRLSVARSTPTHLVGIGIRQSFNIFCSSPPRCATHAPYAWFF